MSQIEWDAGLPPVAAACAGDDVIITVNGSPEVRAYDADGGVLGAVDIRATAEGEEPAPEPCSWTGVALCGSDDSVVVLSDAGNSRVCVMHCADPMLEDPVLMLAQARPMTHDGAPWLQRPQGLAVDRETGAFLVADAGRCSCVLFVPASPLLRDALRHGADQTQADRLRTEERSAFAVTAELVGASDPYAVALVRVAAGGKEGEGGLTQLLAVVSDRGRHRIAVHIVEERLLSPTGEEPAVVEEAWGLGGPGREDGEVVQPLGVAVWAPKRFAAEGAAAGGPLTAQETVLVVADSANARLQAWPLCGPPKSVLWVIEHTGEGEEEALRRPCGVCLSSEGEALVVDSHRGVWIVLPEDTGGAVDPQSDAARALGLAGSLPPSPRPGPGTDPAAESGVPGPAWEAALDASSSDDSFLRAAREEVRASMPHGGGEGKEEEDGGDDGEAAALAGMSEDEGDREARALASGPGAARWGAGTVTLEQAEHRTTASGAQGGAAAEGWPPGTADHGTYGGGGSAAEAARRERLGLRPRGDPYRPPAWHVRGEAEYAPPEPWRARRLELHPPGRGPEAARARVRRQRRRESRLAGAADPARLARARRRAADAAQDDLRAARQRRRSAGRSGDDTSLRDEGRSLVRRMAQLEAEQRVQAELLAAAARRNDKAVAALSAFAPALALAGAAPRQTPAIAAGPTAEAGERPRAGAGLASERPPLPRWLDPDEVPPVPPYDGCRSERALRARLVDIDAAARVVRDEARRWEAQGSGPAAEAARLRAVVEGIGSKAGRAASAVRDGRVLTRGSAADAVRAAEEAAAAARADLRAAVEDADEADARWELRRRAVHEELASTRGGAESARRHASLAASELRAAERRVALLREERDELLQREATLPPGRGAP